MCFVAHQGNTPSDLSPRVVVSGPPVWNVGGFRDRYFVLPDPFIVPVVPPKPCLALPALANIHPGKTNLGMIEKMR